MARVLIRIEPIIPKHQAFPMQKYQKFIDDMEKYLRFTLNRRLTEEMKRTTTRWSKPPQFKGTYSEPYHTRQQLVVAPYGRNTLKWIRVSEGTGPRSIVSDNVMVFPREYTPHTRPGGKYGGPGEKYGPIQRTHVVNRHRIEPRKFSKFIAMKEEGKIRRDVEGIARRAFR